MSPRSFDRLQLILTFVGALICIVGYYILDSQRSGILLCSLLGFFQAMAVVRGFLYKEVAAATRAGGVSYDAQHSQFVCHMLIYAIGSIFCLGVAIRMMIDLWV